MLLFDSMKAKRITLTLTGMVLATSPVVLAVSCGAEKEGKFNLPVVNSWKDKLTTTNQNLWFEAKITHWTDGDTVSFRPTDAHGTAIADGKTSLRIQNIDSPEVNHNFAGSVAVDATEEFWGQKSKELGEKLIPVGSRVKIWSVGSFSYNRLVGSIFYGPEYKNYAIEQLAAGLSLPIMSINTAFNPANINSFLLEEAANAFNNALINKVGLHSLGQAKLEEVLSAHGVKSWNELLYSKRSEGGNVYSLLNAMKEGN